MSSPVHLISVFTSPTSPADGGNLCPVVLDASSLSDSDMQSIAKQYGHECAFLLPGITGAHRIRFFVPGHEMEMCGHATAGTTWLLRKLGHIGKSAEVTFTTMSGTVHARVVEGEGEGEGQDMFTEISQPKGSVETVQDKDVERETLDVLGLTDVDLQPGIPIQNARTSRVKTMVPIKDVETLHDLKPDFSRMKTICKKLGSTGLYPYAISSSSSQQPGEPTKLEARQFPKESGYPEDAATGIAAAALSFALLHNKVLGPEKMVIVSQGTAMGCPSEIRVRIEDDEQRCWVGGMSRWVQK